MENSGILNIGHPLQMAVLQFVYMPRIQQNLDLFEVMWNNHKLKGTNSSPVQLFNKGDLLSGVRGGFSDDHFLQVDEQYGVDLEYEGIDRTADAVLVDDLHTMFEVELNALSRNFDPLLDDGSEKILVFQNCKEFLEL